MEANKNNFNNVQGIRLLLRSLRHRNYRLYFIGQGTSLIGTWMQQVAMSWLVYRLTNSAFLLGLVGFSSQIPAFIIAPLAGVFADKWNRKSILIVTQTLLMLQALALAALVLSGNIYLWHIIALSIFIGLVNSFDMPTRQAFVYELVEEEDLPNAIALNSMIFNGARLAGPSIAGILIAAAGEGACFLLNAVSFIAVLAAMLMIRPPPQKTIQHQGGVLSELKNGLMYAFGFMPIRSLLSLLALVSLVGASYGVLMPIFARDILLGGPITLGFLMGSAGIGALCAAIFLASRKSVQGLGKIIVLATSIFGSAIIAFSFSHLLWCSLLLMLFAGSGMMAQMASINTILQTIVDDDKRGRIMSLYTAAFLGMVPLGSLLAGSVAHWLGAPHTLQINGLLCIAGAVAFWSKLPAIRQMVHPIYVRKGIIPQMATGIDTVTQLTSQTRE